MQSIQSTEQLTGALIRVDYYKKSLHEIEIKAN